MKRLVTAGKVAKINAEALNFSATSYLFHDPPKRVHRFGGICKNPLGKVQRTIFLCHYLSSEELRREIQEGLNVIENWNSATNFIHFGRLGEFSTNSIEDQELAMLALHLLQISLTFVQTLMIQ